MDADTTTSTLEAYILNQEEGILPLLSSKVLPEQISKLPPNQLHNSDQSSENLSEDDNKDSYVTDFSTNRKTK